MRIIAGEFRGRKLLGPETEITRPITDRVKQSLFDILTPVIEGAMVYDCFCGTGSMGLESISRGAKHVTFFDADRSAIERLRKNIEAMKVRDQTTVIAGDIFRMVGKLGQRKEGIDIVFFDPPYRFLTENPSDLKSLAKTLSAQLSPTGTLVFRHDAGDSLTLPNLIQFDERIYGSMTLEFLRPANTPAS